MASALRLQMWPPSTAKWMWMVQDSMATRVGLGELSGSIEIHLNDLICFIDLLRS